MLECLSPFQPILMFVGKARSLPLSGSPEKVVSGFTGKILTWLERTNTLAYYEHSSIMEEKSFIKLFPSLTRFFVYKPGFHIYTQHVNCNKTAQLIVANFLVSDFHLLFMEMVGSEVPVTFPSHGPRNGMMQMVATDQGPML